MNLEMVLLWRRADFKCCGSIRTSYMEEIEVARVMSCACDIGCHWKKWNRGGGTRCGEGIGLEARASKA